MKISQGKMYFYIKVLGHFLLVSCHYCFRSLLTVENGSTITEGTIIKRPAYAQTLKRIKNNPEDMYEGALAQDIVDDIKNNGGVMTLEDLRDYKVKTTEIMKMKLDDLTLQTLPLPAAGPILIHMLMMGKGKNTQAPSTIIGIILKMHLFYPYKKDPRPHEDHFQISPSTGKRCDIRNLLFEIEIRYSITTFDIRTLIKEKRKTKCPRMIPEEPSACSGVW